MKRLLCFLLLILLLIPVNVSAYASNNSGIQQTNLSYGVAYAENYTVTNAFKVQQVSDMSSIKKIDLTGLTVLKEKTDYYQLVDEKIDGIEETSGANRYFKKSMTDMSNLTATNTHNLKLSRIFYDINNTNKDTNYNDSKFNEVRPYIFPTKYVESGMKKNSSGMVTKEADGDTRIIEAAQKHHRAARRAGRRGCRTASTSHALL